MPRRNSGLLTPDKKVAPNAIYQAYRHLLDAVFVQQRLSKEDFENLYVFRRCEPVKRRFALPFQQYANMELLSDPIMDTEFDLRPEFGLQERELLSFLLTDVDTDGKYLRLVGEVGTGKSTFLRFMFNEYLPQQKFFREGKILYIDFSDILIAHERYDYELTVERVCWELLKRLVGDERAKQEFRILSEELILDRLRELGDHLGRSKVVVVFDNVDTWPTTFQQNLALFMQQLAQAGKCTVVIAMRPLNVKSFACDCEGAALSYLLSQRPPLLHEVIKRRLEQSLACKTDYQLPRAIVMEGSRFNVEFRDIKGYIGNFIELLMHENIRRALENLTNYNVRLALIWTLDFLMSSHIDIPQLLGPALKAQVVAGPVKSVDAMETFILAMALRDHQTYFPSVSNLENLFSAHLANTEHDLLIKLRCLLFCRAYEFSVEAEALKQHLSRFGYSDREQRMALNQLLRATRRLLLPLEGDSFETLKRLKISAAGEYYLDDLLFRANYLQTVADDISLTQDVITTGGNIYDRFEGLVQVLEVIGNQEIADYRRFLSDRGDKAQLTEVYGDSPIFYAVLRSLQGTIQRLGESGAMPDSTARETLLASIDERSSRILKDFRQTLNLPQESV